MTNNVLNIYNAMQEYVFILYHDKVPRAYLLMMNILKIPKKKISALSVGCLVQNNNSPLNQRALDKLQCLELLVKHPSIHCSLLAKRSLCKCFLCVVSCSSEVVNVP